MAEQGKSWLLKLLGWVPLPQTKILSAAAQKGQERLNQAPQQQSTNEENIPEAEAKPVFRTKEEYQQWLAQQGTGTKIKEKFAVGWARTKARADGALPEQQQTPPQDSSYQLPPGPQSSDSKSKKAMALIMTLLAVAGSAGYVFLTPQGNNLLGGGTKLIAPLSATAVPLVKASLSNIWEVLVLGKIPEQTFSGEKVKTEDKQDIGIKIENLKPRRDVYPSPSAIEVEGRLTAVSPTDKQVSVEVTANAKPDPLSILTGLNGESLDCQIQGAAPNQKIKGTDIVGRRFICASRSKFCAELAVGDQTGAIKTIPIDITASILGTTTTATKTIYFASEDTLAGTANPVNDLGIPKDELIAKQEGDTTINFGIGLAGGEDIIAVANSNNNGLTSDYLMGISIKNPGIASGTATPTELVLYVESPPANLINNESSDFKCDQLSGDASRPISGCVLKTSTFDELTTGKSQTFYLKFAVPASELKGKYGSFRVRADLTYDYATPSATTATIKSYQGDKKKCCELLNLECPKQKTSPSQTLPI